MEKINILLVDDRPENLLALEAVLASPDYSLVSVTSGEEALKSILQKDFAVILMDVQMPGLDGFETAELIRAREKSKDIPIIFLTALSQTQYHVRQGYAVGAIDYIFKPYSPIVLKSKVEGFVKIYKSQKQIQKQNELIKKQADELRVAYGKLEGLVQERTKELRISNQHLQQEIEEKQGMVQRIKESEQMYKSLFENHPDAVYSLDLEGRCLSFNQELSKLTGLTGDELANKPLIEMVTEKDKEKVVTHFHLAIKGEPQHYDMELIQKDGNLVWINVTNIPIIVDENIVGVYGIAKDISLQRTLWDQIYESEEKYRQLVEESPEAIIVQRLDSGNWSFINQKGLSLLGADHQMEVVGQSLDRFIHPADLKKVESHILEVKAGKKVPSIECRLLTLDNRIVDAQVKCIPFNHNGVPSLHIVVNDLTELKQSREFIKESEKLTVVGELAAGIAHEIRNPLTSLRGFTQLLEYQANLHTEYIPIMIAEIDRINTIVGELLLLAKPNQMDFEKVEILELLDTIATFMSAQANLHGVNIILDTDLKKPLYTYGLENKMKQVFINLLKNSIEAMANGGVITVGIKKHNEKIVIEFIDEGKGIPKDLLDKIGQPFFTTKEEGTGLGIMVCRSIIENHKGVMNIESEEGVGTKVEIILNAHVPEVVHMK